MSLIWPKTVTEMATPKIYEDIRLEDSEEPVTLYQKYNFVFPYISLHIHSNKNAVSKELGLSF
jgi:hypothetical protein